GQRVGGSILADQAHKGTASAKARNVARDIAGAADQHLAFCHGKHRGRGFRRDAANIAVDELVKHQVADAEHALAADALEVVLELEHWMLSLDWRLLATQG